MRQHRSGRLWLAGMAGRQNKERRRLPRRPLTESSRPPGHHHHDEKADRRESTSPSLWARRVPSRWTDLTSSRLDSELPATRDIFKFLNRTWPPARTRDIHAR